MLNAPSPHRLSSWVPHAEAWPPLTGIASLWFAGIEDRACGWLTNAIVGDQSYLPKPTALPLVLHLSQKHTFFGCLRASLMQFIVGYLLLVFHLIK